MSTLVELAGKMEDGKIKRKHIFHSETLIRK